MIFQQSKAPPHEREGAAVQLPDWAKTKTSGASLAQKTLPGKTHQAGRSVRYPTRYHVGVWNSLSVYWHPMTGYAVERLSPWAYLVPLPDSALADVAWLSETDIERLVDDIEASGDRLFDAMDITLLNGLDAAYRAEDTADDQGKELASFEIAQARHLAQSLSIVRHAMGVGGEV